MKLALALVRSLLIWPTIGKPFMAPVQEGGFRIREKKDFPHVHNFESVPVLDKEREYKYFKVNAVDTPKDPNEDASSIITQIQLYHYAIGVSEETLCKSSYTPRKVLFAFSRTTCLKVFSFVIFDPIQCRK
jgi:hypothetical protein